jgi:hypothetical protein
MKLAVIQLDDSVLVVRGRHFPHRVDRTKTPRKNAEFSRPTAKREADWVQLYVGIPEDAASGLENPVIRARYPRACLEEADDQTLLCLEARI